MVYLGDIGQELSKSIAGWLGHHVPEEMVFLYVIGAA